ncbi:ribonuclease J [Philodulcilactobacillus myokoensis]|uniref:Ribonuclease J n=1 Tax=Philodulcilactobacillus myokoensis TaxID=2929573 RepID=A0A9W6ESN9_9LACO|nr:ribonuclease J [Philodulcilactobacillus myokoensis]GLB46985.1 ribonuclease J [Philodulcilactobacillus myokoensis]
MKSNIKIIPLGGVRENGENMYAVEVSGYIYILDCGLRYPDNEMLGIDLVIPDFTYLESKKDKIVGVFLSHGHSEAIGALPYFLRDFDVPVFGSKLTIELAKMEINQHKETKSFDKFNVINENSEIIFNNDVTVSFFKTTHSIPESMGIVLSTKEGQIVYTGDFKFDQTAQKGYRTDFSSLSDIGRKGVLALLSDSSNAENPYESVSENKISSYITDTFQYTDDRIIVASVAYNILRIQQIFNAAYQSHRKVYLAGHDLNKIVKIATDLHQLHLPDENIILHSIRSMNKLKPSQIVILQTGKMGEPINAIQRMANQQNRHINIRENDLVLIATTPSHAMETNVAKTKDMIYRANAHVKMISDDLNSSENASQNDLQLMLNLMKPKFFIPVQGEYRMLNAHAKLAESVGIPKNHIFIPNKGDVIEYNSENHKMYRGTAVKAGSVMIDGIGVGDIGNIVLRDRKVLSEDGIFIAVITIDRKKRQVVAKPKLTSRGYIYVKTHKNLMNECSKLVYNTVQKNLDNEEFDWGHLKQSVREKLNSYLFKKTQSHPVILPVIMEINQHHRKNMKKKKFIHNK